MSESAARYGANNLSLIKKYQSLYDLLLKLQQIQMYPDGNLTLDH